MADAKHTAGPVFFEGPYIIAKSDGQKIAIIPDQPRGVLGEGHRNLEANAALITEAFNVATETGMTPRQLADKLYEVQSIAKDRAEELQKLVRRHAKQRAELLAALADIAEGNCPSHIINLASDAPTQAEAQRRFHMAFSAWMQEIAKAAIAKAEGKQP